MQMIYYIPNYISYRRYSPHSHAVQRPHSKSNIGGVNDIWLGIKQHQTRYDWIPTNTCAMIPINTSPRLTLPSFPFIRQLVKLWCGPRHILCNCQHLLITNISNTWLVHPWQSILITTNVPSVVHLIAVVCSATYDQDWLYNTKMRFIMSPSTPIISPGQTLSNWCSSLSSTFPLI